MVDVDTTRFRVGATHGGGCHCMDATELDAKPVGVSFEEYMRVCTQLANVIEFIKVWRAREAAEHGNSGKNLEEMDKLLQKEAAEQTFTNGL